VTDEQDCLNNCTLNHDCVAVDVVHSDINDIRCWPHFDPGDIRERNIFTQQGNTLYIPVKRCIASLYCEQCYDLVDVVFFSPTSKMLTIETWISKKMAKIEYGMNRT